MLSIQEQFLNLVSTEEVLAEFPLLSRRHLQTLRSTGRLPYFVIRGRACYLRSDIDAYPASCRRRGAGSPRSGVER